MQVSAVTSVARGDVDSEKKNPSLILVCQSRLFSLSSLLILYYES